MIQNVLIALKTPAPNLSNHSEIKSLEMLTISIARGDDSSNFHNEDYIQANHMPSMTGQTTMRTDPLPWRRNTQHQVALECGWASLPTQGH